MMSYTREFGGGTGKFDWESEYFSIISVHWEGIEGLEKLAEFGNRIERLQEKITSDRHRLGAGPYQRLPELDEISEEDLRFLEEAEFKLDDMEVKIWDKVDRMNNNESYAKEDMEAEVGAWWDSMSPNEREQQIQWHQADNWEDHKNRSWQELQSMGYIDDASGAIADARDEYTGKFFANQGLDDEQNAQAGGDWDGNDSPEWSNSWRGALHNDILTTKSGNVWSFRESYAKEEDPMIEQVWQGFQNDGTIGDEKSDWELYAEYKLDEDEIEAKWNKEEGTESISIEDYESPDYLIVDDEEDKGIIDAEDVGSEDPFNVKGLTDNPLFDFESFQKKHSMCKGCMQNSLEKLSRESQMSDALLSQMGGDFEDYEEWENFALANGVSQQEAIDSYNSYLEGNDPIFNFESKASEDGYSTARRIMKQQIRVMREEGDTDGADDLEWKLENGYYDEFGATGTQNPDLAESYTSEGGDSDWVDNPDEWGFNTFDEDGQTVYREIDTNEEIPMTDPRVMRRVLGNNESKTSEDYPPALPEGKKLCPRCGGSGEIDKDIYGQSIGGIYECERCNGDGLIEDSPTWKPNYDPSFPIESYSKETHIGCPYCKATGYDDTLDGKHKCEHCNGTGKVDKGKAMMYYFGGDSYSTEDVELDVEEVWEDWLDGNHDTLYTENSWYGYAEKNGVSFMDALDVWANNSDELSNEGYEDDIEDYKAEQNEDPSLYPEEIEALSPEELKRYQGKLGGDEFSKDMDELGKHAGYKHKDEDEEEQSKEYTKDIQNILDRTNVLKQDMTEDEIKYGIPQEDLDKSKENITGYVVFDEDGNTVEREFSEDDAIHHATRIKGFVQPEEEGGYLGDVTFDARQPVYGQLEEQLTESQLLQKGNESYKVLENNSNIRFE